MFHLTRQERFALLWLVIIFLTGSVLDYVFKKYPGINNIVNFVDSDNVYPKVDINTASKEELVSVPFIGEYTARNVIDYRQSHGPFLRTEDVKAVKGIREKNYKIFSRYIKVSGNGGK